MKIRTFIASGLIVGGLVSGSRAEQKVLAQVEIRGLDKVAADVATLTEAAGQPMPGEALLGMAGGALGSPELTGLDVSGVFRLIVLESEGFPEAPPTAALIAPVIGDGQAYLEAVGQGMEAAGEEDGVHTFTKGANAPPMGPPEMHIGLVDGGAVIGMEADAVRQVRGMAAGFFSSTGAQIPGTVAVRVDVATLLEIVEPMMDEKMGEMKKALEAAEEQEKSVAPPTMPEMDVAKVLDAEVDFMMGLMRQLDQLGLGLGVADGALQIHSVMQPKSDSPFADALADSRPPVDAVRTALPADALYAQAMFIPGLDMMIEPYIDFMTDLYAGMGPEMLELAGPMMTIMKDIDGLYPGDVAMGVVPGKDGEWPAFVEVATVTDPDRMLKMIDDMIAVQEGFADTEALGYTYSLTREVSRTHRDIDITSYTIQMEFGDDMAKSMPPGFDTFFQNLRYDLAFVNDLAVYSMGPSNATEATIDRLLDGTGAAVTQGAAFRSRFPLLAQEPLDAFTMNLFDAARAVLTLVPEEMSESAPPIPQGPGTLAGYTEVRDGSLRSTMAVGLADIAAVSEWVQQAMPKQGGMAGGGPGSCTQNLRQLAIVCYMHEAEAGTLPAAWDEVGAQLGAPTPFGPPALLVCPNATDPSVPSYRMVASGSLSDITSPGTTVLVEEVAPHHDGKRHVAYGDGHVELVD